MYGAVQYREVDDIIILIMTAIIYLAISRFEKE
jgi:hypothetical protein